MASLRNAILVAVLAATSIAAVAGYFLTGEPPGRLLVDAGLAGAVAIAIVLMLNPTVNRTQQLAEALRALARGDRHQRVNPDEFAGLADVARALNEVAASLTEHEDANLGPVKSQPHPTFKKRPERPRPDPSTTPEPDLSDHPELGPVRVHKKKDGPSSLTIGEAMSEAIAAKNAKSSPPSPPSPSSPASPGSSPLSSSPSSSSSDPPKNGSDGPKNGAHVEVAPSVGAPSNDTSIDDAPRAHSSEGNGAPASAQSQLTEAMAQVPSRIELEALFQEFVAAKKSHDESIDLDFEAFAQTIQGECERLIVAHQCKGVRFEVLEQDGEVSLRPRLLR